MSDPATINYQPLQAMQNSWWTAFVQSLRTPLGALFFTLTIVAIIVGIFSGLYNLGFPVGIFYLSYLAYRVKKYRNAAWQQFAAANGWPLDTVTSQQVLVPPSLQFGHGREFSPIIRAQLGAVASDLMTYECTTGAGRSQTTHYFTVALVPLPRSLPHLVLLSKKAHADVQRDIGNKQELKLEGDFNDHFSLQIEKGQQIDALTVITPDVMQTLLQYNQAEDIEILGNTLYFILNKDRRGVRDVQQLIQSVMQLTAQITENSNLSHAPAVPVTQTPLTTAAPTLPLPPVAPAPNAV